MQNTSSQIFAVLLTFGCLSLVVPQTSFGATTKFPSENPAFTVDLPSGWKCEPDKKGNLSCTPRDGSAYNFTILNLDGVQSAKQLKAALPKLASSAGLENFKVGEVEETEGDAMRFLEVKGRGESDGMTMVVVVTGFEAVKGRFFALLGVGLEKTDKKYAKDYEAIAGSIQPIR